MVLFGALLLKLKEKGNCPLVSTDDLGMSSHALGLTFCDVTDTEQQMGSST